MVIQFRTSAKLSFYWRKKTFEIQLLNAKREKANTTSFFLQTLEVNTKSSCIHISSFRYFTLTLLHLVFVDIFFEVILSGNLTLYDLKRNGKRVSQSAKLEPR